MPESLSQVSFTLTQPLPQRERCIIPSPLGGEVAVE